MTAVTVAQIITAMSTAKPSTQAVDRFSGLAAPTSMAIDRKLATIRILIVRSSKAPQKSSQKPGGSDCFLRLDPKASTRLCSSVSSPGMPLLSSLLSPKLLRSLPLKNQSTGEAFTVAKWSIYSAKLRFWHLSTISTRPCLSIWKLLIWNLYIHFGNSEGFYWTLNGRITIHRPPFPLTISSSDPRDWIIFSQEVWFIGQKALFLLFRP